MRIVGTAGWLRGIEDDERELVGLALVCGSPEQAERRPRGDFKVYTEPEPGEVAEWLKALAC